MLPSGKNSNDVRSADHSGHKNRLRCLIQGQRHSISSQPRTEAQKSFFTIYSICPLSCSEFRRGCDSPMVKVLDHGRQVMSSSPVPLSTRYVGQRCTLNRLRAETSSRWCGS
ncbi:hypothetical protein TNCV_1546551 [Trichonephila clavipes]|nr:hypothetical protein TNCV_1546551 [Trichonephila clavipes]